MTDATIDLDPLGVRQRDALIAALLELVGALDAARATVRVESPAIGRARNRVALHGRLLADRPAYRQLRVEVVESGDAVDERRVRGGRFVGAAVVWGANEIGELDEGAHGWLVLPALETRS